MIDKIDQNRIGQERDSAIPLHLLRLVSQSLPVGNFSYSRGLESAVEAGWVSDEATASSWILGTLQHNIAQLDGALFWRMMLALIEGDHLRFLNANDWLRAARESREFQLEDDRLGSALLRLLISLNVPLVNEGQSHKLSFAAAFAVAAHHWDIPACAALKGLLWTYVEGQVMAAIRLIPIGQTAGQRILISGVDAIERTAVRARSIADDEVGSIAPALAIASAWHETQYSRLFQS
ncbi:MULTISPECIES: urease accessory UreF family protein [unclassified Beijerinckia]|uniref:urease accessory protein UreF n=1 Tax=unclassified Beijerinckia TaxID=2638183 RepID=UPI000897E8E6|nr:MULTISPECIES: urease accessory UreF family protein [unclassified Beijerinckia]MDH7798862.1 urease accessory protein [Beijerinckia sp. GAS462]SED88652.1 urease accessory protein [Beijerinckia sp. 28-YEA-48]